MRGYWTKLLSWPKIKYICWKFLVNTGSISLASIQAQTPLFDQFPATGYYVVTIRKVSGNWNFTVQILDNVQGIIRSYTPWNHSITGVEVLRMTEIGTYRIESSIPVPGHDPGITVGTANIELEMTYDTRWGGISSYRG